MKTGIRKIRRAFTLIEMSVVIMVGMMIGTMVIAIFNQQLAFLRIYQVQSFTTEEAPMISNYLNRLIGKADRFRLHETMSDALAGANPQTAESQICVLNFRAPDRSVRPSILAFENTPDGDRLNYYVVPESGAMGTPQWSVTRRAANVQFYMEQGILRTLITGPQGEQLIYSGSMQ